MAEKKKTEITIGCDPEYGIVSNGRLISPNDVISGSDSEFGIDGSGRVAELRPPYANDPKELTENIMKVLKKGYANNPGLKEYKMKAGGTVVDEPIGGHIHFGHPALKMPDRARLVADALDRTVSVLNLMIEDQEEAINRRIGSGYGQVGSGSYRDQPWGMEYRVLPSWLTTPEECEGILSLAYIVACEHHDDDIMNEACSLPAYDNLSFRECDKIGLMYYLEPIVKFIKGLPRYDKYESAIRPIWKLIKNQKVWSCDKDMRDTWDLKSASKKKEVSFV